MRLNLRVRAAPQSRAAFLGALVILAIAGCHGQAAPSVVAGGNVQRGKAEIGAYGCGACHTIPGVRGAHGMVGPPLNGFALRAFIAGEAPNTVRTLVQWIRAPQSIEPGTAMPTLGVTEAQARDIAAYLYTLR